MSRASDFNAYLANTQVRPSWGPVARGELLHIARSGRGDYYSSGRTSRTFGEMVSLLIESSCPLT
jgi:hypothetical protein